MKLLKRTYSLIVTLTFILSLAITVTVCVGQVSPKLKEYRIDKAISEEAQQCIDCHLTHGAGIVADWANSRHAHVNISCIDCHATGATDTDASKKHLEYSEIKVSPIVSPKDCSRGSKKL